MTELLEQAMDHARALPSDLQDEIARLVLSFAGEDGGPIVLTAEEDDAISRSMEAADRGEFATAAQVGAVWTKHGL